MRNTVTLRVIEGPLVGSVFTFAGRDALVFGRAHDCGVRLPDEDLSASRRHFILEVDPPEARLRDLGSVRGTIVNRVRFGGRARGGGRSSEVKLEHGDIVEVGQTVLRVEVSTGQPAPERGDAGGGGGLSGYELGAEIGAGGMGIVHLAHRRATGETVAVKRIRPSHPLNEGARARFQREIGVTASLNHPNLVRLIEHGSEGETLYLVMEYCAGGSVGDLVRPPVSRLPPPEACRIALQVLDGLGHAHDCGFVHRDIKPRNILLTTRPGGTARLADFGLAKSFELAGLSGYTLTGMVAGTFAFMPREQLVDFKYARPVSDVWSMGATLYHLLTGRLPRDFQAKSRPADVVRLQDVIPIRDRDPDIPPGIAEVVDRAIADDVGRRYPDASRFREALAAVV